uniref:Iron-sulfur-binding protein, glutamate synthase subunit (DsrL/GltD) n=1 Tax=uncultured sulfate-reducing bacterium TaxID=153939 RepID=Q3IBS8_9BACT|nr:Iron-sulfur-binding protein, glutamate synthase subunit (DsrL/GltD) [uncultured sulfate-reducing bacterium]
MGLLKKKDKKKKGMSTRFSGGGGGNQLSALRPRYVEMMPPCVGHCPSGNKIRGWLTVIALREKLGLTLDQACEKAWRIEMETTPFPAVMGRVCPHPCETECNREAKDGAVGINSVERFIGDYGLEHGLKAERIEGEGDKDEKIAVIGAGPSGMSCAYQLARRGYPVTVYESLPKVGGMLRYGIPVYRLPRDIIDGEVQTILDLGVELHLDTKIGKDVTFAELRENFKAIYVAIGAHQGKKLGIGGEDGPGIWTGTEFLNHANSGKKVEIGGNVVVIGGGDTAIDAARVSKRVTIDSATVSKRMGADVTILYRRTRKEMPAIEREIDEALEEGVNIEYLAAPIEILRNDDGTVRAMIVQRMELGEPDASGRRRPVPIEGDTYELPVETVITAVSQKPDLGALGSEELGDGWLNADDQGRTETKGIWTGGDNINLGIATTSIGQGRKAAENIHAWLQGLEVKEPPTPEMIMSDKLKIDWYETKPRGVRRLAEPEERLAKPFDEVDLGLTAEAALEETTRCMSCGRCFGCENCWMYCQNTCFVKEQKPKPGAFYSIILEKCDGCKKCWEECPCGFIVGV